MAGAFSVKLVPAAGTNTGNRMNITCSRHRQALSPGSLETARSPSDILRIGGKPLWVVIFSPESILELDRSQRPTTGRLQHPALGDSMTASLQTTRDGNFNIAASGLPATTNTRGSNPVRSVSVTA